MKKVFLLFVLVLLFITTASAVYTSLVPTAEEYRVFQERGEKVATLQNYYIGVYVDEKTYDIVYQTLKQYIDDPLDCRLWFGMHEWVFSSIYVKDSREQEALWLGYDELGELKAVCTAHYNLDTMMFSEVDWFHYGYTEEVA